MTIKIDHRIAKDVLFLEYANTDSGVSDQLSVEWLSRVNHLSDLCPPRKSSTFIAALGTALLAKSVEPAVDVYCLLDRDGGENSYSARSLADNVWAKNRALLGIDLGANGPNPLNNTPFIGKGRIDEIRNVRNASGFTYLMECLDRLRHYTSTAQARSALRGFILSRKKDFSTSFVVGEAAGDHFVLPTLEAAIRSLISVDSEDGRCAQAVAAGLLAANPSTSDIEVGHINDPDRNFPLDIAVYYPVNDDRRLSLAIEVKDKAVGTAEVLSSLEKALNFDVRTVIYLAISSRQVQVDFSTESIRARDMGCNLIIYTSWADFIRSCIGFSSDAGPVLYSHIYKLIGQYLQELGVSQAGIDVWTGFAEE
ncbi:restriction endonuclease, SacI family [Pseudomonas sp. NPDC099000]|uniref:restriction endonuclease, SacI family n=1 Tax=Pseudomonas sp. NPDC099000 TaxID=3364488 RepID=UPI003839E9B1